MKLGLIGRHIQKTRSNELHEFLGREYGIDVSYELFDRIIYSPEDLSQVLASLGREGYRGVNVTQPYKVWAWDQVAQRNNLDTDRLGALNTVVLGESPQAFQGTNTDCTGFTHAFRDQFGAAAPGRVLIKGTGGVGRAIAFALVHLGADHLDLIDTQEDSASQLMADLKASGATSVRCNPDEAEALAEAAGVVNATPIGHYATPGNPFEQKTLGRQAWAFDAVYTPIMTPFMNQAEAAGLDILTGYELFLYQGIDAFEFFTGVQVDPDLARKGVSV